MNIKTVSVTYERKINLGDYNSATIGITMWADVEPEENENLDEIMGALWSMAKENVKAQAIPLVRRQQAEVIEVFMGLPKEVREKFPAKANGHEIFEHEEV